MSESRRWTLYVPEGERFSDVRVRESGPVSMYLGISGNSSLHCIGSSPATIGRGRKPSSGGRTRAAQCER
jgi:hypothetical protein